MKDKTCRDCEECFPATTEYFPVQRRALDGLDYLCKSCRREYTRQYRLARKHGQKHFRRVRKHSAQFVYAHNILLNSAQEGAIEAEYRRSGASVGAIVRMALDAYFGLVTRRSSAPAAIFERGRDA